MCMGVLPALALGGPKAAAMSVISPLAATAMVLKGKKKPDPAAPVAYQPQPQTAANSSLFNSSYGNQGG